MTKKTTDNFISITDVLEQKKLRKDYSSYHSEMFNKDFKIDKIKPSTIVAIMNDSESDEYEKYAKLLYNSCSFFRSKELQRECEAENPYDVVPEVFGDNYAEIFEFGNLILEKYGFTGDRIERVKKQ